jgi:hypothetical protein
MGQDPEINFLESYFDIPGKMVSALTDNISWIDTTLYKLNALKKNSKTA